MVNQELSELARDPLSGGPVYLSDEQKEEFYNTGRFAVPSNQFQGQSHVWKLNGVIFRGRQVSRHTKVNI